VSSMELGIMSTCRNIIRIWHPGCSRLRIPFSQQKCGTSILVERVSVRQVSNLSTYETFGGKACVGIPSVMSMTSVFSSGYPTGRGWDTMSWSSIFDWIADATARLFRILLLLLCID
jgi:hypothetical protein